MRLRRVVNLAPGSRAVATGVEQLDERMAALGGTRLAREGTGNGVLVGTRADLTELVRLAGDGADLPADARRPDGYAVRCFNDADGNGVAVCLGFDERGCYYALQTLGQLLRRDGDSVTVPACEIVDWPSFPVRLVKNSATRGAPAVVEKIARTLPRYKINVYALQYHKERNGTWREPSEKYVRNIATVGEIARSEGVLDPALFLCPFFPPKIDLTRAEDIRLYVERLKWGVRQGYKWVEIDFNDWGTWEQLNQAEREEFGDLADYMARLTNAAYEGVRAEAPDLGVILCTDPPCYRGHPKPNLVKVCGSIPEDILVYWTGPVTRSRTISERQVREWTAATGRKPFLWDNTIYSHFQPFWVGYALNPYHNYFPPNLADLLEAGVHLNSTATELYLPGMLTFADFVWNPEGYGPERSIRNAMFLCWGDAGGAAGVRVRERLGDVHRMLTEATAGMSEFDKTAALAALEQLRDEAQRLGEITENAALARELQRAIVVNAEKAIQDFTPPTANRSYVRKPLAEGVLNGGAEDVVEGRPRNWCLYSGGAKAEATADKDAHSGQYSARLRAVDWYHDPKHLTHGDRKWLNVALIHGSDADGYVGADAYDVDPGTMYRCRFWLKGDTAAVKVTAQGWGMGFAAGRRITLDTFPADIVPTEAWTRHEVRFQTSFHTRKVAIKFGILGYEDSGARLGTVRIDDLSIEPEAGR